MSAFHQRVQRWIIRDIENRIADPDAHARRAMPVAKDAERKILERKIRIGRVGGFHPTGQRRIVRFIEAHKPILLHIRAARLSVAHALLRAVSRLFATRADSEALAQAY